MYEHLSPTHNLSQASIADLPEPWAEVNFPGNPAIVGDGNIIDALTFKMAEECVAREYVPNNRMLMDENNNNNNKYNNNNKKNNVTSHGRTFTNARSPTSM